MRFSLRLRRTRFLLWRRERVTPECTAANKRIDRHWSTAYYN